MTIPQQGGQDPEEDFNEDTAELFSVHLHRIQSPNLSGTLAPRPPRNVIYGSARRYVEKLFVHKINVRRLPVVLKPSRTGSSMATPDPAHRLQQSEGVVKSVSDEGFVALIMDAESVLPDHAEFQWDEIDPADVSRLRQPGALFVWQLIVRTDSEGRRETVSRVVPILPEPLGLEDEARAREFADNVRGDLRART